MAATYDVHDHPLLSAAAKQLVSDDPSAFDAQAITAERVLGLRGTQLTGDDAEDARVAIVRQLNLQLQIDAMGGANVVSESKGAQSYTYAQHNGERVAIDRIALSIARQLVGARCAPLPRTTEIAPVW